MFLKRLKLDLIAWLKVVKKLFTIKIVKSKFAKNKTKNLNLINTSKVPVHMTLTKKKIVKGRKNWRKTKNATVCLWRERSKNYLDRCVGSQLQHKTHVKKRRVKYCISNFSDQEHKNQAPPSTNQNKICKRWREANITVQLQRWKTVRWDEVHW